MTKTNVPRLRFNGFSGEWERLELKSVAEVNDGLHQTPNYKNEGIPFFSVENLKHMKTKKYISQGDYLKEFKNKSPKKGDILMSRIGSVGETNIINDNVPLAFYVTLALLRPNKKLNSIFFNYLLKSPTVQIEIWRRTLHVAFPKKINKNEISKIQLNISDEIEQQKIGEFFAKQDKLIELQTQKVDQLKKLKRGYLQKMFPQEGETAPRLRFSGFSGEWKEEKLKETLKVGKSGGTPSTKNKEYYDGTIPFLSIKDVTESNGIINDTEKHINNDAIQNSSSWIVPKGSLTISMYASIGSVAKFSTDVATSQAFFNMIFKDGINVDFMYYFFNQYNFMGRWNRLIATGTQGNLNATEINNIHIRIPSEIEQRKIGCLLYKLDQMINNQSDKVYELRQQKKAYLQKMFV